MENKRKSGVVSPTLKEARKLYDLGFAIHWLRPKSKIPLESGWTTGPRKTWRELERAFKPGYNVGVRTGSASQIGEQGYYLACIDVDVKKPECGRDAVAALKKLISESACFSMGALPTVSSGAGNGSRHVYCVTKEPFKMITVEKHEGWEICVYSEGRQMVLPPSIHPSGARYEWGLAPSSTPPLLEFKQTDSEEAQTPARRKASADNAVEDFEIDETCDIRWLPEITDKTRKLIEKGLWNGKIVEDRSAYLLPAASSLVASGFDKSAVLTILTDPSTYLGLCAYDHAKTKSRKRAALWLWNYTVKKVMSERDPKNIFKGVAIEESELDEADAAAQALELVGTPKDRGYYSKGVKGALKPEYDELLKDFETDHPFKTIADMKTVFAFNGTHYVDLTPIEIKGYAEKSFNPRPEEKLRSEFLNKVLSNNITRRTFFADTIEGRLNFKNGVLDLSLKETTLKPHSPEYGFRGVLPYDFDDEAECPTFKNWLRDVMCGDAQLQAILQEFMGYVVRGGDYKYHKALWLGGVGRNGKSTFVDVLKAMIGTGNYTTLSIKSLIGDKFAGSELDGKLANFSEETSPQELADSGPFKNLTGDGELIVQKKYGDLYPMRNKAKLIMTYNVIPDIKDLSKGMLSRPIIVPFEKEIAEKDQDRNTKKKLFTELPGILNFALDGWARLERQGGFTQSSKSELALQTMREESCSVFQWIEGCIEFAGDDFFSDEERAHAFKPAELYSRYLTTNRYPHKYLDFCKKLAAHPKMKERKSMSKGMPYYGKIRNVIG